MFFRYGKKRRQKKSILQYSPTSIRPSKKFKPNSIRPNVNPNLKKKWIVNLSNTELNNTQTAVLEKGFNFAITPKSIPKLDIVTGVETGLRKIRNAASVTIACSKVAEILKTASPPPNRNVTREEEEALKELKNNEKNVILKADKGNATVVMNTEDYQYVWNLYRNEKINKKCYYYLRCSNAITPRFYDLPKIHKSSVPLRPIVSFVNSPTYNLSKFLSRVLSSLLKNNYSVRNSREFVECIKNYSVKENECLVSFDVVSLFTPVPVDKALALVLEFLASDDSLPSRTRLSISDIKQGLQICLDSTVFSYKKSFFKQTLGTPMGSCISPIIANLYMEHIEHTAITTFHTPPNLWLRYVEEKTRFVFLTRNTFLDSTLILILFALTFSLLWKTNTIFLFLFLTF